METGQVVGLTGEYSQFVRLALFGPDGRRVLTVPGDRCRYRSFSPDGRPRGGGERNGEDHRAILWDATTGKPLVVLKGNWRAIGSAAWSPDGRRVATAHEDGVHIWDAVSGKEVLRLRPQPAHPLALKRMTSVAFSPDGGRVVTWDDERLAHWGFTFSPPEPGQTDLWEAATGRHIATLLGHAARVNSAAFSPDGRLLVTTAEGVNSFSSGGTLGAFGRQEDTNFRDRTARLWDAVTGKPLRVLRGHERAVHSAAFSADGNWLVTTSEDRTARIWDVATGKEYFTLRGHQDALRSATFSPDSQSVLTTSWDGTARIWPVDPLPLAVARQPRALTAEERERFEIPSPAARE